MKCSIEGCPGEYELRRLTQTLRRNGEAVVVDHVPAEVCTVCGDTLFSPETVRRIETLLETATVPDRTAPVYEFS